MRSLPRRREGRCETRSSWCGMFCSPPRHKGTKERQVQGRVLLHVAWTIGGIGFQPVIPTPKSLETRQTHSLSHKRSQPLRCRSDLELDGRQDGQNRVRTLLKAPQGSSSNDLFIQIQKQTLMVPTARPTAETLPPAFPWCRWCPSGERAQMSGRRMQNDCKGAPIINRQFAL